MVNGSDEWNQWRGHTQAILDNMDKAIKTLTEKSDEIMKNMATKDELKNIDLRLSRLEKIVWKVTGAAMALSALVSLGVKFII